MKTFHIETADRATLGDLDFDGFMALQGESYREIAARRTLRFERGGNSYFIKIHHGVGWAEIFKNLITLKVPVIGAGNEWRAIQRLEQLGVSTMRLAAWGERGGNPACKESFVVTHDLGATVDLDELTKHWRDDPPPLVFKRALLNAVADIARILHQNGVNHRDFYLCHFLLDRAAAEARTPDIRGKLFIIDLHRVQLRARVPKRWLIKDMGGLYHSALDIGLSKWDVLRFVRRYTGRPLRESFSEILDERAAIWRAVSCKARELYVKAHGREPGMPL